MLIGALGIQAVSQLYQSFKAQGPDPNVPAAASPPPAAPASSSDQALTTPQPPTDQSPISQAAAKLITDLHALLLGVQAGNTSAATTSAATSANASTSNVNAAAGSTAASSPTDPAATLQNDLQALSGDLKQAGGARHHHHHHGDAQPASGSADPSSSDAPGSAANPTGNSQASTQGSLFSQLSRALNAYASSAGGGSHLTTALTA